MGLMDLDEVRNPKGGTDAHDRSEKSSLSLIWRVVLVSIDFLIGQRPKIVDFHTHIRTFMIM